MAVLILAQPCPLSGKSDRADLPDWPSSDAGSDIRHAGVSNAIGVLWPLRRESPRHFTGDFLLWRSRNRCLKLRCPYLGTDALSRFACILPMVEWLFAAFLAVEGFSLWGGQAMGSFRQRRVLSSITLKRRRSWLLAASALVSSSLGVSEPALAQVCVPPPSTPDASGNATCTGAFNTSIAYSAIANQTLHVTLAPPVSVTLAAPGIAVDLNNFNNPGSPILLSANGATINVAGDRGLSIESVSANATITASGQIDVTGFGGGNHAIKAFVNTGPGDASVTYGVPGAPGQLLPGADLSSSGTNSTFIQAETLNGNARIDASGNMSSSGQSNDLFFGLFAQTGATGQPGDASVMYHSGTINVQGSNSVGIFAAAQGNGSAEITTLPGTTIIVSGNNPGDPLDPAIAAEIFGTAAAGKKIMVDAASTIHMFGSRAPDSSLTNDPIGIRALSRARRIPRQSS